MNEISKNLPSDQTTVGQGTVNQQEQAVLEGLEQIFLAELMKVSGVGSLHASGVDNEAEQHLTSFLQEQYVDAISGIGGVGIAEQMFRART